MFQVQLSFVVNLSNVFLVQLSDFSFRLLVVIIVIIIIIIIIIIVSVDTDKVGLSVNYRRKPVSTSGCTVQYTMPYRLPTEDRLVQQLLCLAASPK